MSFQAEELNTLVGDAFRMAFASQLHPSAPIWVSILSPTAYLLLDQAMSATSAEFVKWQRPSYGFTFAMILTNLFRLILTAKRLIANFRRITFIELSTYHFDFPHS